MRRYQVLVESEFPAELNGLFKNLESKGNPWGLNASSRLDWAAELDFEVNVVKDSVAEYEYLFWVGCAGAYEDRAKKTSQAVAELLHMAGVSFAVLGSGETCTGDSARRAGNEFLFQMLAQQNVETLNEVGAKKIVATCAHCFNTLGNEYPQLGGHYEVVHHSQLLNRLVRYNTVQEQANTNWTTSSAALSLLELPLTQQSPPPEVRLRFTDLSMLANAQTKRYLVKDEVKAVMARRDKIVATFQTLIAQKGEKETLY